MTIYFFDEHEGLYVFQELQKLIGTKKGNRDKAKRIQFTEPNALTIDLKKDDAYSDMVKPSIVRMIARHIITTREDDWILQTLEQDFYYTDEDEQQQILAIVQSFLEGDDKDIPKLNDFPAREDVIVDSLNDFFENQTMFSYESFLQFRLKRYHELLYKYIESGIDEYKLEQEYQEFIHMLRQLIKDRVSLFSKVHLVDESGDYKLLNEHFYELSGKDMEHLLRLQRVDAYPIASDLLRLLINLAPRKLFLYTDNEDASMNQTILNVFQERVQILSKADIHRQKHLYEKGHTIGLDFRH